MTISLRILASALPFHDVALPVVLLVRLSQTFQIEQKGFQRAVLIPRPRVAEATRAKTTNRQPHLLSFPHHFPARSRSRVPLEAQRPFPVAKAGDVNASHVSGKC